MITDLTRIDVAVADEQSGGGLVLRAAAADWEPEALRLAQCGVKLSMMARLAGLAKECTLELYCAKPPPFAAAALARRLEVRLVGPKNRPTPGRIPSLPDGQLDWTAIQVANAAAFAAEHGLPADDPEGMTRVDEILRASRREGARTPDAFGQPALDGDLLILAGAYTGELLREPMGGQWMGPVTDPADAAEGYDLPYLSLSFFGRSVGLDVLGQLRDDMRAGPGDSFAGLRSVMDRAQRRQ